MSSTPTILWRCFPWDREAAPGELFSPRYLAPGQSVGRFDLHDGPPVRYFAESDIHAVGEVLADFRGTTFRRSYLLRHGRPLALVQVTATSTLLSRVVDCADPTVLASLQLRPDDLAHHDRRVTQGIARRLHDAGYAGLRWWSAITGAWHVTVIFDDRATKRDLAFGEPASLSADHHAVADALPVLGIRSV